MPKIVENEENLAKNPTPTPMESSDDEHNIEKPKQKSKAPYVMTEKRREAFQKAVEQKKINALARKEAKDKELEVFEKEKAAKIEKKKAKEFGKFKKQLAELETSSDEEIVVKKSAKPKKKKVIYIDEEEEPEKNIVIINKMETPKHIPTTSQALPPKPRHLFL